MERQEQDLLTEERVARPPRRLFSGLTPRAVVLGALLVAVLVVTNPYLAFITNFWTVGSGAILAGPWPRCS